MLKCLYDHDLIHILDEKRYFTAGKKSLLSHIIVSLELEYKIFPYLIYFIEKLGFAPHLKR